MSFSLTVEQVEKHMESLQSRYSKDKRLYADPPSGSAPVHIPPEEKAFIKHMDFLRDHIIPRKTQNTLVSSPPSFIESLIIKYDIKPFIKGPCKSEEMEVW